MQNSITDLLHEVQEASEARLMKSRMYKCTLEGINSSPISCWLLVTLHLSPFTFLISWSMHSMKYECDSSSSVLALLTALCLSFRCETVYKKAKSWLGWKIRICSHDIRRLVYMDKRMVWWNWNMVKWTTVCKQKSHKMIT